jgi:hypothetical protein
MQHSLSCECGAFRAHVTLPVPAARAICYCKDCQAYARLLGKEDRILDADGGTDIIATMPSHVQIEQGREQLTCVRLTEKGPLRWYTRCCGTPIGNSARDPKVHYIGLIHTALAQPITPSFGPAGARLNTGSARGKVAAAPRQTLAAMFKIMRFMLPARLSKARQADNPFFDAGTAQPIAKPTLLSEEELTRLRGG